MSRPIRALLVIENDPVKRETIIDALKSDEIEMDAVGSASEALATLHSRPYQGIVLELDLPDMDGIALLHEIQAPIVAGRIPTVIYTTRTLDTDAEDQLRLLDAAIVAESDRSLDRLRQEAAPFLQRVRSGLRDSMAAAPETAPASVQSPTERSPPCNHWKVRMYWSSMTTCAICSR